MKIRVVSRLLQSDIKVIAAAKRSNRCPAGSGATGLMREGRRVEPPARTALAAQTIERALPLGGEVGVEHQRCIAVDHQPGIVLHLEVELAARPAGMTQRQPGLLGTS